MHPGGVSMWLTFVYEGRKKRLNKKTWLPSKSVFLRSLNQWATLRSGIEYKSLTFKPVWYKWWIEITCLMIFFLFFFLFRTSSYEIQPLSLTWAAALCWPAGYSVEHWLLRFGCVVSSGEVRHWKAQLRSLLGVYRLREVLLGRGPEGLWTDPNATYATSFRLKVTLIVLQVVCILI